MGERHLDEDNHAGEQQLLNQHDDLPVPTPLHICIREEAEFRSGIVILGMLAVKQGIKVRREEIGVPAMPRVSCKSGPERGCPMGMPKQYTTKATPAAMA
jgi:hypothetical protein